MKRKINIRKEHPSDFSFVSELIRKAFASLEISNHNEDKLVENLRKSAGFTDELSLIAEVDGRIAGHILFSPVRIENGLQSFKSLVLAPVSVLPEFQKQGIGGALITEGHKKAAECGFSSVILLGHPQYYPRFGYKPASTWGIKTHYNLPSDDVFMAVELTEHALKNVSGMVIFPPEFDE